jgi:glutaredoxin-like protein
MSLLNDKIKAEVQKAFADIAGPVKLVMFTQQQDALECQFCIETRTLVEEIATLSDKLSMVVYDFVADKAAVEQYKVDKIPALAIVGAKDYGVRHYGIPSGYEFGSIIQDILHVSTGQSGLSEKSKAEIAKINQPVHIQVFVTPT